MAIMVTLDEMLTKLQETHPDTAQPLVDEARELVEKVAMKMAALHNEAHPETPVRISKFDRIELWDGCIMVGFSPEDESNPGPLPPILKGLDDGGWEFDEAPDGP